MRSSFLLRSAAAMLAGTAIASPAVAQLASLPTLPRSRVLDDNNVDLASGSYVSPAAEISIGTEQSGITFNETLVSGQWWISNYHIALETTASTAVIAYGTKKQTFNGSGTSFTPADADGSTLTYNTTTQVYTCTLRDGTIITIPNSTRRGSSIKRPEGSLYTLYYDQNSVTGPPAATFYRLRSIGSSDGFQVRLTYALASMSNNANNFREWATPSSAVAVNNTSEACQASAASCSFAAGWPTLIFSGTLNLTVTDPTGDARYTSTLYSAGNYRVTAVKRPSSATDNTAISYDANNRVSQVVTDNRTWTYAYSLSGSQMTTSVTAPGESVPRVVVSDVSLGEPLSNQNELGRTITFARDANGRMTRVTQPEGNYAEFTYDTRGNTTQIKRVAKTPGTPADIVTSATFPATCIPNALSCNKPITTTDARGNVTDYTYDTTHGGILSMTLPAPSVGAVRPQIRFGYTSLQAYFKNSAGSIVASGVPTYRMTSISQCKTMASCAGGTDEIKTTATYGSQVAGTANNLWPLTVSQGSGDGLLTATTTLTYGSIGDVTFADGPLAGNVDRTRFYYDASRRVWASIGPDPDGAGPLLRRAYRTTFAADSEIKTEIGSTTAQGLVAWDDFVVSHQLETSYDPSGRKIRDSLKNGTTTYAVTQYSYDGKGRLECTAVRMNPDAFGSLPASACSAGSAGAQGPDRITKMTYNSGDQVTNVQVSVGTLNPFYERTLTYTNNGKLATLLDGENNLTAYEYDGQDRLAKTYFPSATKGAGSSNGSDYLQLTYETTSAGTRTSDTIATIRNRAAQFIGYTYDALTRVTLKDLPSAEPDVSYTYDNLGRLGSANQTGNTLSFTYDALGRVLTETGPQGTVNSVWDVGGRRSQLTYPSGLYFNYDYLVTGEVSKIRENGATTGVGVLATYNYDDLGRRTGVTFGNAASQNFSYDPASRLATLTNDLAGTTNDLSVTFTYNAASQLASAVRTGDLYAWTAAISENRPYTSNGLNQHTAAGTTNFVYDAKGNLTSDGTSSFTYSSENLLVTGPNSSALTYDPQLRLYQLASASTTRFAYDGVNRIAEYDGSNVLQRQYVHGPGADEPIVWYEGAGTSGRRFLSADERGSIISVTDSNGNVLGLNKYDEYGIPQSGNLGKFGYTGQTWLPEIGLNYFKARMYSPTMGRFLQTDPIAQDDTLNPYAYVKNDPVNARDPLGLTRRLWGGENGGTICRNVCGIIFVSNTYEVAWSWNDPRDHSAGIRIWSVTHLGSDRRGIGFFDGMDGIELAGLNFAEGVAARTAYAANPQIRENIRRIVRSVTGKTYSNKQIDAVMKNILTGASTEISGLKILGEIDNIRNLSPLERSILDTYIRELPSNPLNNELKSSWGKFNKGG